MPSITVAHADRTDTFEVSDPRTALEQAETASREYAI